MPYPLIFWQARQDSVDRPEEYRCKSLGYHIQTGNKDDFLSFDFDPKGSSLFYFIFLYIHIR
jgi:hypothetical protein